MNRETRPLLLMLALSASAGAPLPTPVSAPETVPPADIIERLRTATQARLPQLQVQRPVQPGAQTVQFYNFPQFPNYFYNCIRGYWRNC